jgi:3-isopropylmalate dehydrogenase
MSYSIAVLDGDGIGPETIADTLRVLDATADAFGFSLTVEHYPFGGNAIDSHGDPFPEHVRAAVKAADAVIKGAVGGPKWDTGAVRPEMGLLALRAELEVFANIRPVRRWTTRTSSPLKPELAEGIDMVILRELTGGLYFGPKELDADHGLDTCAYTRGEVERIVRRAFELARTRRGRLCSVDKMNVLSSSKLWRAVVLDLAAEYPDVELTHQLVDSMAMKLVEQPAAYDVIVTENMFGDILSDLAASIGGGIGLAPPSSVGSGRPGLYEAIHGSAPDIAGRGIANPTATILSAAMMLRDLGEVAAADAIEATVIRLLDEGPVTPDLGGSATTEEFGAAVVSAVRAAAEVISR